MFIFLAERSGIEFVSGIDLVNFTSVSEGALVIYITRRVKIKCDRCFQTFPKIHQNVKNSRKYKSSFLLNSDIQRLNLAASGLIMNKLWIDTTIHTKLIKKRLYTPTNTELPKRTGDTNAARMHAGGRIDDVGGYSGG